MFMAVSKYLAETVTWQSGGFALLGFGLTSVIVILIRATDSLLFNASAKLCKAFSMLSIEPSPFLQRGLFHAVVSTYRGSPHIPTPNFNFPPIFPPFFSCFPLIFLFPSAISEREKGDIRSGDSGRCGRTSGTGGIVGLRPPFLSHGIPQPSPSGRAFFCSFSLPAGIG